MKERLRKFNKISNFKILALCVLMVVGIMYYYEEVRIVEKIELPTVEVVVPKSDIPAGAILSREMFVIERRYEDYVLKQGSVATTLDEVVGKRAGVPLYKGEMVSSERLLMIGGSVNKKGAGIAFKINEVDRALNLKKGDFIDIWAVPVVSGLDANYVPAYKVFEKVQIDEIVNMDLQIIDDSKENVDANSIIPLYIILQLDDKEVVKFYDIDMAYSGIRFARYDESRIYNIMNEKMSEPIMVEESLGLIESVGDEEKADAEVGEGYGQGVN
jgi:hypothetical protein